jgi:hypothetical protein
MMLGRDFLLTNKFGGTIKALPEENKANTIFITNHCFRPHASTRLKMGITLSYCRISEGRLNYLRIAQDEELVAECMNEDHSEPSDSLAQIENSEFLDLDKLYPLVSRFLNPNNDPVSVFYGVTHRGKSVIDDPTYSVDDYLGVVYYLTPSEVQLISQAINQIPQHEWEERYRILMDDETIEEGRSRSEFPIYSIPK